MFGRKKQQDRPAEVRVSVLCKFWQEDGVWNASAEHLPVAAFGGTIEEAQRHLCDAVATHFINAQEAGNIEEVITYLKKREEDRMIPLEIEPDEFLGRMLVPTGHETVCA